MEIFYKDTIEEQKQFWNNRAKPCSHYERLSEYAADFISLSGIMPGESVFDMGCGSGTLCLPLADSGHRVFGADFSVNMLKSVQDVIDEEKIDLITLKEMSWQEDWEKLDLPICDLAFASRCMFGLDAEDAVRKLSSRAKRRVCISLPVSSKLFENPGSAYKLDNSDELSAFAASCMSAVRKMGYEPKASRMGETKNGESCWLFIKWDITIPLKEEKDGTS